MPSALQESVISTDPSGINFPNSPVNKNLFHQTNEKSFHSIQVKKIHFNFSLSLSFSFYHAEREPGEGLQFCGVQHNKMQQKEKSLSKGRNPIKGQAPFQALEESNTSRTTVFSQKWGLIGTNGHEEPHWEHGHALQGEEEVAGTVTSTLGVIFRFLIHPPAFGKSPHEPNSQQLILRRWSCKCFGWNHFVVGKSLHSVPLDEISSPTGGTATTSRDHQGPSAGD